MLRPGSALLVFAVAACGGAKTPTRPAAAASAAVPRIEATLQLPNGDGRVHVIVLPTGYLESMRCIVAVPASGAQISTACAPKDFDLPPIDEK